MAGHSAGSRKLRVDPEWVLIIDTIDPEVRGSVSGPDLDQLETPAGTPVSELQRMSPIVLLRTDAGTAPLKTELLWCTDPVSITLRIEYAGTTHRVTAPTLTAALTELGELLDPAFLRTCSTCRFGAEAGRVLWQWCARPTLAGERVLVPAFHWCDQHEPV